MFETPSSLTRIQCSASARRLNRTEAEHTVNEKANINSNHQTGLGQKACFILTLAIAVTETKDCRMAIASLTVLYLRPNSSLEMYSLMLELNG